MNYTTYYEQSESISEERYGELKGILEAEPKRKFSAFHLRKLEFREPQTEKQQLTFIFV